MVEDATRVPARVWREAVRGLVEAEPPTDSGRVSAPTLVIWGERDNWVPVQHALELRRSIPEASLVILRGAAHMPMVDRPEAFNRLVERFLDGEAVGS